MARGVTETHVHTAADELIPSDERLTDDRIRVHLGTGSPSQDFIASARISKMRRGKHGMCPLGRPTQRRPGIFTRTQFSNPDFKTPRY